MYTSRETPCISSVIFLIECWESVCNLMAQVANQKIMSQQCVRILFHNCMCIRCTLRFYKVQHIYVKVRSISDKLCQVEQCTKECNKRCTEQLELVINDIDNVHNNSVYYDRHNC